MTIGIIGLGLIGGSMAKAFRRDPDSVILGMDTDERTVEAALLSRDIDGRLTEDKYGLCDLILLAAPCSMQSLVSLDSHPMRPISEREEKALAQRQTALLQSALKALRPGGQIVYSTCTLSPDEDEAVVDDILHRFHGKVRVCDAAERLPWPAPGITSAYGREFDPSLKGAVRLWPHRYGTAGFFACLLEKTDYFAADTAGDAHR